MKKILLIISVLAVLLLPSRVSSPLQSTENPVSSYDPEDIQGTTVPENMPAVETDTTFVTTEEVLESPANNYYKTLNDEYFSTQGGAGIVISSPSESKGQNIQIIIPGHKEPRLLFSTEEDILMLLPSPDGKSLMVKTVHADQPVGKNYTLEIYNVDENKFIPILSNVWLWSEVWCNDSNKIASIYSPDEGVFNLGIYSRAGEEIANLPFTDFAGYHLVGWGDNDRDLILMRQVGGGILDDKMIVFNYETQAVKDVFSVDYSREGKSIGPVFFTENSKKVFGLIYYHNTIDRNFKDLFMVDVESGKLEYLIKAGDEASLIVSNLYLSKDDSALFFLCTKEPLTKGELLNDYILYKLTITEKKLLPIMTITSSALSLLGWENENNLYYSDISSDGSLVIGAISLTENKTYEFLRLSQSGFMSIVDTN